jgi:PAP2 superfamily protein
VWRGAPCLRGAGGGTHDAVAGGIDATLSLGPVARVDAPPRLAAWRAHPLAPLFVAVQLALLVLVAPLYGRFGLTFDWSTSAPMFAAQAGFLGAWLYFRRYRYDPRKSAALDVILGTTLLVTLTAIVAPAQYVAVALRRPLIDPHLAAADAAIGINVASLARWTAAHPSLTIGLALAYVSFLPQLFLPVVVLGLVFRERDALWEFVFHYHFCLLATLIALALFPAACAFQYYGVASAFDQSRFVAHFGALRDGTFHVIAFTNMEGLISMPSFHVAGGLMVTWAFRRHRALFGPLALLNVVMIAATFLSGAHYFVDVVASCALFGVSAAAYRAMA